MNIKQAVPCYHAVPLPRRVGLVLAVLIWSAGFCHTACATPSIVVDAQTGAVLAGSEANRPWYPASLTKLMTIYIALTAVRDGHVTLQTPFIISQNANHMPPSKMGFKPGTEVTLGNALKMLTVKSANDIAVMIAEGISGSVAQFADEMNRQAAKLGMVNTHFVNPNGLHNPDHVSSARDMAVLARALLQEFPEQADLYNIGAMEIDGAVIPTHNGLLGRYPGADGMKTGFTCSSGFNIVASATQNGRKLLVVILGSTTAKLRTEKAAGLFNAGFASTTSLGALNSIPAGTGLPPDMHHLACGHRSRNAVLESETEDLSAPIVPVSAGVAGEAVTMASLPKPVFTPVPVFAGRESGWSGGSVSASNPVVKPLPESITAYVPQAGPEDHLATPFKIDPNAKPLNLTGSALKTVPLPPLKTAELHQKLKKPVKIIKKPRLMQSFTTHNQN